MLPFIVIIWCLFLNYFFLWQKFILEYKLILMLLAFAVNSCCCPSNGFYLRFSEAPFFDALAVDDLSGVGLLRSSIVCFGYSFFSRGVLLESKLNENFTQSVISFWSDFFFKFYLNAHDVRNKIPRKYLPFDLLRSEVVLVLSILLVGLRIQECSTNGFI